MKKISADAKARKKAVDDDAKQKWEASAAKEKAAIDEETAAARAVAVAEGEADEKASVKAALEQAAKDLAGPPAAGGGLFGSIKNMRHTLL